MVTLASGRSSRLDALVGGDRILAASAEGVLVYDEISRFSLAQPDALGVTFAELSLSGGRTLALTSGHHMPTGHSCCTLLKQAKDVRVGDLLWATVDTSLPTGDAVIATPPTRTVA